MNHLGVFAKYWQPGAVKTRLAAAIGNENAARLYREFVHQTLKRHSAVAHDRSLWIWPEDKASEFQHICGDRWSLLTQSPGNLGHKMMDYFDQTLAIESVNASVLIGTDSPNLPCNIIQQAFDALKTASCVLGPSQDGGYYLIGLSEPVQQLFSNIEWSSSHVLEQTIAKLEHANAPWTRLPDWNDVDDANDLRQLLTQLETQRETQPEPVETGGDTDSLDAQLLDAIRKFGIPTP